MTRSTAVLMAAWCGTLIGGYGQKFALQLHTRARPLDQQKFASYVPMYKYT